MYIYEIAYNLKVYNTHSIYLSHSLFFSPSEFEVLLVDAAEAVMEEYLDQALDGSLIREWYVTFHDLMVPISNWLITKRGFSKLKITSSATFEGLPLIVPERGTMLARRSLRENRMNHLVTKRFMDTGLAQRILEKNEEILALVRKKDDV